MGPFQKLTGKAAVMNRMNVDTDQIIPKQFLKRVERTGFGQFLFYDWRMNEDGSENQSFELNRPENKDAQLLIAGRNFGCGSSREHAPWALLDYGFQVIIAPSFADIFYNNCIKNGILPVVLTDEEVAAIMEDTEAGNSTWTADLPSQTVTGNGRTAHFDIDAYWKEMLLNGWDEIDITLNYQEAITAYEEKQMHAC